MSTRFYVTRYSTYGRILNRGRADKLGAFNLAVGGRLGTKDIVSVFSVSLGQGEYVSVKLPRFAKVNRWYHMAGVYDGKWVRVYINGELAGQTEVPANLQGPIYEEAGTDLFVGKCSRRRTWHDTHINGMLDEVRLFDQALSQRQVKQLYTPKRALLKP